MTGNWTTKLLAVLAITAVPGIATAQDFNPPSPFAGWTIISAGPRLHADKFLGSEVRFTHILDQDYFHFHPVLDFSVGNDGAFWVGAGVYVEGELETKAGNLFIGGSFAPGFYHKGNGFDLGYPLEFRSGIEAGIKTNNGYRISLSYDHRSNARIRKINPGMETIQLRIGKHFN